jgi:hypothetical protein
MSSRLACLARLALFAVLGTGVALAPTHVEAAPAKGKRAKAAGKGGKAKPAKDPGDEDKPADKPATDQAGAPAPVSADGGLPATTAADGAKAEAPVETGPADMEGTAENPTAPPDFDAPPPFVAPTVVSRPKGYPIEEVWRPLTLPRLMTEVSLDTGNTFSPFVNGFTLRAHFGVTSKVQIGITYNIGGIYDDGRGTTTFNTGKAVDINGRVQLRPWVAAQLSVPMYLQPFAASVTLGAPMKFRFSEQYALVVAEDVIDIRLSKFVPSLTNEAANEGNVSNVDTNTRTDQGNFRFSARGIYQYKRNVAFTGRFAVTLIDFSTLRLGYLLKAGGQVTVKKGVDLSATLGFENLDDASHSFGLQLGAALRF